MKQFVEKKIDRQTNGGRVCAHRISGTKYARKTFVYLVVFVHGVLIRTGNILEFQGGGKKKEHLLFFSFATQGISARAPSGLFEESDCSDGRKRARGRRVRKNGIKRDVSRLVGNVNISPCT